MKPIIVNETNRCTIDALIIGVEGRATSRTIGYEHIVDACKNIEMKLGIPKKYLEGVRFDVDIHAQNFPKAYKYCAESTQFIIEYSGGKWRLLEIERYYTRAAGHAYECRLMPEATRQKIVEVHLCF